ncbi:MAG: 1-deoxy-D-xylulose-5-phosphate reductoisomerase [Saccharofermentanales bacterium]
MIKAISILGSTGSIGVQTLDVARSFGIQVLALSANRNIDRIEKQIREFHPLLVSMADEFAAAELRKRIDDIRPKVTVMSGMEGNIAVARMPGADMVVAAMVGIAGLKPVMEAILSGKDIALANKETLVAGGSIVIPLAQKMEVSIYPVDSEHSAIWQCLVGNSTEDINRIFLTASGGPFRGKKRDELLNVDISQTLSHPTWKMGGKITVDSATLMNKGLEVIEAHWLFDVPESMIEVVVHPQSIIHSMVEYKDGSVMAQLGFPDMKLPIQIALMKKERVSGEHKPFDPFTANILTFERPDTETFRCLELAYEASQAGGSMPAVLNSANEKAVELFMNGEIGFLDIAAYIEKTMDMHMQTNFTDEIDFQAIQELDFWARNYVDALKQNRG